MQFKVYFENGQTTTINAENISTARKEAEKISAVDKCYANTDTVEGLQAAALTVVKRVTAHMINNESTPDQHRLYISAKCKPVTDPDVLDMISEATVALWAAIQEGKDVAEQHKAAYKAVNKYLYHERRIDTAKTAAKTVYIEALNGVDIVNVNKETAKLLDLAKPYNPIPVLIENPTVQAEKAAVGRDILTNCTDKQVKALNLKIKGLSVRQSAEKLHIAPATCQQRIDGARNKGEKLYPDIAEKYEKWNKTTVDNSKDSDLTFEDFEKLMQNDF